MNTPLVQDICYSLLSQASHDRIAIGATKLEREIDGMVYALYGLTPEEIKIVEEGAGK